MAKRRKSPVEIETTEPHMCSPALRLKILRGLPFFRTVADEDLAAINARFREQGFSPGEFIYHSGDPGERLYVLAEGRARLLRLTSGGKQVMLDLLIPGDFFGALGQAGTAYPDSAEALTPICALAISVDDFREVLRQHPATALDVLDAMAARLQAAHDAIHLLSAAPAEARVAHILLKLAGKLGVQDEAGLLIQTPLGREALAEMTGITTETASRVISQFQRDGWIETGRQWIALRDTAALEELVAVEG